MLRIEQTYLIHAKPERVWAALTEPAELEKWTGHPAVFEGRVGGKYVLWTDYVSGKIIEYDPPEKLVQSWKPVDWTIENSIVTFHLTPIDDGTHLYLIHEHVQPEDYEGTKNGWGEFYIGAIRDLLEHEKPAVSAPPAESKPALNPRKTTRAAGAAKPTSRKKSASSAKKKRAPVKRAARKTLA